MTLQELLSALNDARLVGTAASHAQAVANVRDDSRAVTAGDVFVAVRGLRSDGHAFVDAAIARGAVAVVVEKARADVSVPQIVVGNAAAALGRLIAQRLHQPAQRMTLVGITGTNGKTTTSYLVEHILNAAAARTGVIGTVNYRWPKKGAATSTEIDAPYTTPTPDVLHRTFATMADDGVTHAVMEVSSAALTMDRLAGVSFGVAAFSNLTQDHLDVHGSMEAYLAAKRRLFEDHLASGGTAVINVDDPASAAMIAGVGKQARVLRVSSNAVGTDDAEIRVIWRESTVRGIRAKIRTPRGEFAIEAAPLLGDYNVANLALAIGIAEALGIGHAAIVRGIGELRGVPGRVERVTNDADLDILVDYAHTPDALRNVLSALRPLTARRLICVFGCGGDRDPGKRPLMGAAVAELADLAIVTSDNPRTEEPRAIIDAIVPAVPNAFVVDVDRRTAIAAAIAEATPGDIVLIAGKGHEDYQILGTTKTHFDDREEAAAAVALRPRWTLAQIAAITGGRVADAAHAQVAVTGMVIDDRRVKPGDLFVGIVGANHDGAAFWDKAHAGGATALLAQATSTVADGTPAVLVDDTSLALGKLAAAHRRWWAADRPDARLVAITGSSGKTTTKELLAGALSAAAQTHAAIGSLNNETGVPLTLLGLRRHHRFGVLEMGMRGRGQIDYLAKIAEPDVAVIINAGTAHIELLGSTDAIADAKAEIWQHSPSVIVWPADDDRLTQRARSHAPAAATLTFGDAHEADVANVADIVLTTVAPRGAAGTDLTLDVQGSRETLRLGLLGRHAAIDACCALAAAIGAGVEVAVALRGLATVKPPSMRGEVVDVAGRHVIVDCYNANPGSMAASITMLAELADASRSKGVAVLGDMLELGDHARDAHTAVGAQVHALGLGLAVLGSWAEVVAAAAHQPTAVATPDAAARTAFALAGPGDWILLKASRGMRLERVLDAMRELG